ncbi:MAG: HAD family phosphatase [Clostridiaceae bacterium]|jgi:HAD superfamily hydrolase (TIGR01509 family)|nr:HAD family phosphatase [Clostridiaceae bacterium]
MKISGVIFDMDGTLIDSMPYWDNVGAMYLKTCGVSVEANLGTVLRAMSLQEVAKYLKRRYNLRDNPQEIINGIIDLVQDLYEDVIPAKHGALELLEMLRSRNVRLCVATASEKKVAETVLKRLGLFGYFEFIITCEEVGAGKNNPLIFDTALKLLGTDKKYTYVIDDGLHAIKTAKSVGFPTVAVYDKSFDVDNAEIREIAGAYFETLSEVGEYLKGDF